MITVRQADSVGIWVTLRGFVILRKGTLLQCEAAAAEAEAIRKAIE
jgi:hypothetical protein